MDKARQAMRRAVERRSFCILATASPAGEPHAVAVQYVVIDDVLYMTAAEHSRKFRNVEANPRVAVCIPVRRFPIGPPFAVQFRGTAEPIPRDDPDLARLLAAGRLKKLLGPGVERDPTTRFFRVRPDRRVYTYGIAAPLLKMLRNVTAGEGVVEW